MAGEDPLQAPLQAPPEIQVFARKQTSNHSSVSGKLAALVRSFFMSQDEGGLGIIYDNAYTRTPIEVWRDRKANCLSLTALYVLACKSIGLEARYAESLRISRWRRVGATIRYERHIVAVVPAGLGQELVADFLPEVRRGTQLVEKLDEHRVLALFYSNRAVELLAEAQPDRALEVAGRSIQIDPGSGVGWNVLGVIQRNKGLAAEAEQSFLQALRANAKDGAACGNLEDLLRSQGRDEEAQVYRERGLEIRKRDPFFNAFLAEEALNENQWPEAEKRIKQAIRLLPEEPDFHLILARVALAQGHRKEAIKALEKARKWAMPDMQPRYDAKLALLKGDKTS